MTRAKRGESSNWAAVSLSGRAWLPLRGVMYRSFEYISTKSKERQPWNAKVCLERLTDRPLHD